MLVTYAWTVKKQGTGIPSLASMDLDLSAGDWGTSTQVRGPASMDWGRSAGWRGLASIDLSAGTKVPGPTSMDPSMGIEVSCLTLNRPRLGRQELKPKR